MAGTPESVLVQQDFNLIPVLNYVSEPVAGSVNPTAANVGKLYRNTVTGRLEYVRNATTVAVLPYSGTITNADIASGAAITLDKLASNPLARNNHTGTQLAATISDLAAIVKAYRLDEFAAPTGPLNLNAQRITALADPTAATDAATRQFVENLVASSINGHDWKNGVRVAVASNVSLTAPGSTLDSEALVSGDRILLYGQTTAAQNGIYLWTGATTPLARTTDADGPGDVTSGMSIPVQDGTHVGIAILTTPDPITIGSTPLEFTIITSAGTYTTGTGITIVGNTISLTVPVALALGGTGAVDAAGARTNLGVIQRGYAQTLSPLTAGVGLDVVHNLGTLDVAIDVWRISDGASVRIGKARKDVNTITITADLAANGSTLRVLIVPRA